MNGSESQRSGPVTGTPPCCRTSCERRFVGDDVTVGYAVLCSRWLRCEFVAKDVLVPGVPEGCEMSRPESRSTRFRPARRVICGTPNSWEISIRGTGVLGSVPSDV